MTHLPLGLAGDFPESVGRIFELEAEEGDFVQLAEAKALACFSIHVKACHPERHLSSISRGERSLHCHRGRCCPPGSPKKGLRPEGLTEIFQELLCVS